MQSEPGSITSRTGLPQGLLEETAEFLLDVAQYPNTTIAEAGAIAILAGVTGQAFNTPTGTGPNLYINVVAPSGSGKDIIAGGIAKLMAAVLPHVPSVADFKGPGELVSAPGLIKALERKPCFVAIIGELGKRLAIMVNPQAPINEKSLHRTLLQMYSKSGEGEVFDPLAYSDKDKNTAPIQSPAFTLIGESVPETFYEALNEHLITDGLLSRFNIFEARGPRPYRNKAADSYQLDAAFVQRWSALAAHCLSLMHRRAVQRVAWTPEAEAKFDQYERWTTDEINRATGEGARQLWNRAYLKALKLASLAAVGENYVSPAISFRHAMWATDLVAGQTNSLIARFSNGHFGAVAGNEAKQRDHVLKIMAVYYATKNPDAPEFHLQRDGVITKSYIQQRISTLPAFKPKPTQALNDIIRSMLEADELRELPTKQMVETYSTRARAYAVSQPHILMPHLKSHN